MSLLLPLPCRTTRTVTGYTIPIVLTVSLTVASVQAGTATGPVRAWWWLVAVVATVGVAARSVWRERKATNAITSASLMADHLTDRLHEEGQPLLGALCDVTSTSRSHHQQASLKSLVILATQTAQTGCGQPYAHRRAVFYHLQDSRLERVHHSGRTFDTAPRQAFIAGHSPHDDEVLRQASTEDLLAVDDLMTAAPAHFPDPGRRSYRSFISVPVRAAATSYGLLTVDADRPGAFTDRDKATLLLIAAVLAAGYAHAASTATQAHQTIVLTTPLAIPAAGSTDDIVCGPL